MDKLINNKPSLSMNKSIHYMNHLMLSPNNKEVVFLHKWIMETGDVYSRLYTINSDEGELCLLNILAEE